MVFMRAIGGIEKFFPQLKKFAAGQAKGLRNAWKKGLSENSDSGYYHSDRGDKGLKLQRQFGHALAQSSQGITNALCHYAAMTPQERTQIKVGGNINIFKQFLTNLKNGIGDFLGNTDLNNAYHRDTLTRIRDSIDSFRNLIANLQATQHQFATAA